MCVSSVYFPPWFTITATYLIYLYSHVGVLAGFPCAWLHLLWIFNDAIQFHIYIYINNITISVFATLDGCCYSSEYCSITVYIWYRHCGHGCHLYWLILYIIRILYLFIQVWCGLDSDGQHWFRERLGAGSQQTIIWPNDGQDPW